MGTFLYKKTPVPFSKTVTASGTAERLSSTSILVKTFSFQAKKAASDNTGNVFLTTDADLAAGTKEGFEIKPGQTVFHFDEANPADLYDYWIDADNSGDGLVGIYVPA
jgi:hypothetical protein